MHCTHCYFCPISCHDKVSQKSKDAVIKAQVLSGGRGLGTFDDGFKGGVHMICKPGQAAYYAEKMLGHKLVMKQAPNGIPYNVVLLTERVYIRREMYLCIMMDRSSGGPLLVGSPFGGTPQRSSHPGQ